MIDRKQVFLTLAGVTAPVSGVVLRLESRKGLRSSRATQDHPSLTVNGKRIAGNFELAIVSPIVQPERIGSGLVN